MASAVGWDEYNKRWDQIWGDNLPQGQVLGNPSPPFARSMLGAQHVPMFVG